MTLVSIALHLLSSVWRSSFEKIRGTFSTKSTSDGSRSQDLGFKISSGPKRNIRDVGINGQLTKYYKDQMKAGKMRFKAKCHAKL